MKEREQIRGICRRHKDLPYTTVPIGGIKCYTVSATLHCCVFKTKLNRFIALRVGVACLQMTIEPASPIPTVINWGLGQVPPYPTITRGDMFPVPRRLHWLGCKNNVRLMCHINKINHGSMHNLTKMLTYVHRAKT
jgi:hypothetical protein